MVQFIGGRSDLKALLRLCIEVRVCLAHTHTEPAHQVVHFGSIFSLYNYTMVKDALIKTNPYLKDASQRAKLILAAANSSTAI